MDRRGIDACGAVGEAGVTVACIFCPFDEPGHAAQCRVLPHRGGAQAQGGAEIDLARAQSRAICQGNGIAFAGQEGSVGQGLGGRKRAIDRDACARGDKNQVPNGERRQRNRVRPALSVETFGHLGFEGCKFAGGGARGGTGAMVEETTDQKEECQRQARVEIGMLAAVETLVN